MIYTFYEMTLPELAALKARFPEIVIYKTEPHRRIVKFEDACWIIKLI